MKQIISVYRVPFRYDEDKSPTCIFCNIKFNDVNENEVSEFLNKFINFIDSAFKIYQFENIKDLNTLEDATEDEIRLLKEYQFQGKGFSYDFLLYNMPEDEKFVFPEIDYFSSDRFAFGVDFDNENRPILKEHNIDDNSEPPKNLIIFIKGEYIKYQYPYILTVLAEGLSNGTIDTKASLFFSWASLMETILNMATPVYSDKVRFDHVVLENILRINLVNKKKILNKYMDSFIDRKNQKFILKTLYPYSLLFEYVLYVKDLPKEIKPYINHIVSHLNNYEIKSLKDMVAMFGLKSVEKCCQLEQAQG